MPRSERAKQFAPFDALKGLHDALCLKEYEHDRVIKGDLPQEKIEEISTIILNLKKNQPVEVTYFFDGYYKKIEGKSKADILENCIIVGSTKIYFDDIFDIKILN